MYREPTLEEQEKILDSIAQRAVDIEMVAPVLLLLDMIKPLGSLGGQFGQIMVVPFLPMNEEEISLLIDTLGKTENIERLIQKIEFLEKNKKIEETDKSPSLIDRIKNRLKKKG
jgi:hypothetical protein